MAQNGVIRRTRNAGAAWSSVTNTQTANDLYSAFFLNDSVVDYGGKDAAARSTNAGAIWSVTTPADTSASWYSIDFIPGTGLNTSTGYMVGNKGHAAKSTNGGQSWTEENSITTAGLLSVHFINATTGYAVGGGGVIIKTVNGGTDWVSQASPTTKELFSLAFTDTNTALAVGSGGAILKLTRPPTAIVPFKLNGRQEAQYNKDGLYDILLPDGRLFDLQGRKATLKASAIPSGVSPQSSKP